MNERHAPSEPVQPSRAGPFFFMVLLVLVLTLGRPLLADPLLRSAWRLGLVLLLGLLDAALHWTVLRAGPQRPERAGWLLGAQGLLALGLGVLLQNDFVTLTLSLITLGEAVGVLPRARALAVGALLLGVSAAHSLLADGAEGLSRMLWTVPPTAIFVIVWVELYQRQARERQRAERALEELDAAHAKLAAYASQVEVLTRTAERQRMARELHDTLAQGLAGLILQLEAMEAHLRRADTAKVDAILRQARERARATLAEAREAIDDLRAAPAGSTLSEFIRAEAARFSSSTGILCELALEEPSSAPPEVSAHAQRFVTECLANIARHARASKVRVALEKHGENLELTVEDDGAGFEPSAVEGQAGHYGLLGIRERARLAQGRFEIDSSPGKGTRAKLAIPLSGTGG